MSVSFDDSKYGVAMAKDHIANLERQIAQFFKTEPYGQTVEIDIDTGEKIYKYKLTKPMPVRLKGIARDAVVNLRSALDQVMFALGGRGNYFPFSDNAREFETNMKGRCKNIPNEIKALVRGLEPYKGGDDLLYALNALSNTNKHGIITPVALCSGGITFNQATFIGGGPKVKTPIWDRTKNEMELFRVRPETYFDVNLSITAHIVICDVEIVDGQPVAAILNLLVSKVEGIIMAIEVEARKLGLVV